MYGTLGRVALRINKEVGNELIGLTEGVETQSRLVKVSSVMVRREWEGQMARRAFGWWILLWRRGRE